MDKERVFIDGMGQDMRYTSKKLEYISLYINLFYILLEIPDFCLEYFFIGLNRLSDVVSPFWDDMIYLKSNLRIISIAFAANVYRFISRIFIIIDS